MNRESHTRRRFVLLDRDGTINVDNHYISRPDQLQLLPNAVPGLRKLADLGLGLIVVTNQSGIGRGYFDEFRLQAIHDRLLELLQNEGIALDAIYHCPHQPSDGCECRKPATGLVRRAAADFDFDPREAFVVGDKSSDIALGRAVGAVAILVHNTATHLRTESDDSSPDCTVPDLLAAAASISKYLSRTSDLQNRNLSNAARFTEALHG